MYIHDATELAYKNGYKDGYEKAAKEIFEDIRKVVKPITKVVRDGEIIYECPVSLNELEKKYTEDKNV